MAMDLQLYPVLPPLQPYIKDICSLATYNSLETSLFRVLPDTCVELFIHYGAGSLATIREKTQVTSHRSFVVSRMSTFMDVQMPPQTGCMAVCFYPGMACHFFGQRMNVLTDSVTSLADLWHSAGELEAQITAASTCQERVTIIQRELIRHLNQHQVIDKTLVYCLSQIQQTKGHVAIPDLARDVNLSQRQLSRRFQSCIGLAPKEFARMSRFLFSLATLKQHPSLSLTEIAHESGYYDQAHFIHDVNALAGLTPRQLLMAKHIVY